MLKNEPRWLPAPPEYLTQIPFLKATPLKVLQNDTLQYEVECPQGKIKVNANIKQTFQMSNGELYDDMCDMNVLNQPEVLRNLVERYRKDDIFTYIGPTLIVINPYRVIERHFNSNVMCQIRAQILQGSSKGAPHIYMLAGKAYQGMMYGQGKQAIIISGQSGAGKTQSTKYCMQMITSLSHKQSHSIQKKILACNPLLQAFGNAKTVRNDNSSRFGKYVQIFFGNDNAIKGANIISYLLEKSRVVSIAPNQRTYHAFYALTASRQYGAQAPENYQYLKQSNCYQAANLDDLKYFSEINSSMDEIGFDESDREKIWSLVCAILELGNIQFDDKIHRENQSKPCQIVNKTEIPKIAQVLDLNPQVLQKILLFEKKVILKEISFKPYSKQGCMGNRNTLSKAIYNSIFQFIIYKIQLLLNPFSKQSLDSINLLDIFGFQNFKSNSLEQLCINFTNEKLLKQYNKYVFENEMMILREDGLQKQIQEISPPTNDDVIALLSDKRSLFSIINDYTPNTQFKDQDMMHGFQRDYSKNRLLKLDPLNKNNFTIVHSQCEVTYNIEGFKFKNQDKVNSEIQQIYSMLFMNENKVQSGKTLLTKFVKEIEDLVTELSSASNHFVRCIKPNQQKVAQKVHQTYLLNQIRYLGVFQTIQIRRKTFPARKTYEEFIEKFQSAFESGKGKSGKEAILAILIEAKSNQKDYLLGNKRIYLNKQLQAKLNKALYLFFKVKIQKAIQIQRQFRVFRVRKIIKQKIKLLVKRKNIWRRFEAKQRRQITKQSFESIKTLFVERKNKQKQFKQKSEKVEEQTNIKQLEEKQTINQPTLEDQHKQIISNTSNTINASIHTLNEKQGQRFDESFIIETSPKEYKKFSRPIDLDISDIEVGQFNASFREGESIYISSNPQVLFEKNITLDRFECQNKEHNLQKLQQILSQQYKPQINVNQQQSVLFSEDCAFQIQDTPQQWLTNIIFFKAEQFFKRVLRKRTNFIGIERDYKSILVFKSKPLTKSLTLLRLQDEEKALKSFKIILNIGEQQSKFDRIFRLIENLVLLSQSTSQQLKNQIFLQLIKQSNASHEFASIRIYQSLAVFLHIYNPNQEFITAALYLFYQKLQDQQSSDKEEEYLRYLFKKMLKRVQNPYIIRYMPVKYQLMALMCKRAISIAVYLPAGNCILVKVQSYETFKDIKQRLIEQFGINPRRMKVQMFRFFEIINFQLDQIQESPLNQNQLVWDMLAYWELAKQQYKNANSSPPAFFLMVKIAYAYEVYPDDVQGIQLAFAQCYYDYFIGRIRLELSQMSALAACIKKIKLPNQPENQIAGCYPKQMITNFAKQQLAMSMIENLKQIQAEGLSILSIKYRFLEICNECRLAMSMAVPTDQSTKIFFKPKKLYLVENNQIKRQYPMQHILKWAADKQKIVLEIKGGKKECISTKYAFSCGQFLNSLPKLIKRTKKAE